MPEKDWNMIPASSRQKSSLPTLVLALFFAMILVWSIDSSALRRGIRLYPENVARLSFTLPFNLTSISRPNDTMTSSEALATSDNSIDESVGISLPPETRSIDNRKNATLPANETDPANSSSPSSQNLTDSDNNSKTTARLLDWISVKLESGFTADLLDRWLTPGGEPCKDAKTTDIRIPGLDGRDSFQLTTAETHEFMIHAYAQDGTQRCLGGDYFETDISGERWKSRPPIKDLGNGSYIFSLQVHPDFAGDFNLTVVLLFRSFLGLKFSPLRFAYRKEVRRIPIKFTGSPARLPEIRVCEKSDFNREVWAGRWTRHGRNNSCEISHDGRYRCLAATYPCQSPWCTGPLGSLESNGWVYSAHCSFKIFTGEEAWNCLKDRWIFFWGDSNHVDTIRNILNFILFHPEIEAVPRRFDRKFTNPRDRSQTVRITSIFNGHWNDSKNYEGLNSLQDSGFRELLWKYFLEETVPDVMIMNSGLHDGVHWRSLRAYADGATFAAQFWAEVLKSVRDSGKKAPEFIYRTTVATGGYARDLAFNPNKIEAFNLVLLEKLKEKGLLDGVIDNFDMTFPWHFDNRCNDGVHYGRGPAKLPWKDGLIGHQYFVDLMLAHVLFNAICTR